MTAEVRSIQLSGSSLEESVKFYPAKKLLFVYLARRREIIARRTTGNFTRGYEDIRL
jgi:hypothetical protein